MKYALIIAAAHPMYYPHLQRHASAWLQKYPLVKVLCCYKADDELPKIDGVEWISIQELLPVGIKGFYEFIKKSYGLITQINEESLIQKMTLDQVEAIDPVGLLPASLYDLKLALSSKKRYQLLYFSMELYRELPNLRHKFFKRTLWALLESLASKRAQRICTVSKGVANHLSGMLNRDDVEVVRSCPPLLKNVTKVDVRAQLDIKKTTRILVYQGLVEEGRGLTELCEAIKFQVIENSEISTVVNVKNGKSKDWALVVIGDGPDLEKLKQKYGESKGIYFVGRLPYAQSLAWIKGCDAGAVFIQGLSLSFQHCLPGKIFEYMQMNIPVLISPLPDLSHLLSFYPAGVRCSGFQAEDIIRGLEELSDDLDRDAYSGTLDRAQAELNWEQESKKLLGESSNG